MYNVDVLMSQYISLQSTHVMAKTCSRQGLYPPCEELQYFLNSPIYWKIPN